MRGFVAMVLFIGFCYLVYLAATGGEGLPELEAVSGALDTRAAAYDATSQAAEFQAAQIRTAQAIRTQEAAAVSQWIAATGQAEMMAITQAAGRETAAVAMQFTREAFQYTVEAGQANQTATARVLETVTEATKAAMDLQQTADVAGLNAFATEQAQINQRAELELRKKAIETRTAESTWYLKPLGWVAVGIFIAVVVFWLLKMKDDTNIKSIPRAFTGETEAVVAKGKVINPDRGIGPVIDPYHPVSSGTPDQMRVTLTDQGMAGIGRLTRAGYPVSARQAAERLAGQAAAGAQQLPAQGEELPSVAPWDLTGWTGSTLPLGIGVGRTAITLNPERTPNLLVAGTSRSGKTMMGMRPVMAEGLVSGWQVILLNEKGGDFTPLKSHTNLVAVDGEAESVAAVLEGMAREVSRRDRILKEAGISTYYRLTNASQALGPRVMVVIDELVSLINGAPSKAMSDHIWRLAVAITSKCGAMGMMVVIGSTDPSYRTLGRQGLTVRDNCGRMVFRMRDMSSSRAALDIGGAESLTGAQFIAQLDTEAVKGVAFHPEDEDVARFLANRPVAALPQPRWLGGGSVEGSQPEISVWEAETIALAKKIEEVWKAGGSKRAMARSAGFEYVGNHCIKIDRAIEYLVATTTANDDDLAENAEVG